VIVVRDHALTPYGRGAVATTTAKRSIFRAKIRGPKFLEMAEDNKDSADHMSCRKLLWLPYTDTASTKDKVQCFGAATIHCKRQCHHQNMFDIRRFIFPLCKHQT